MQSKARMVRQGRLVKDQNTLRYIFYEFTYIECNRRIHAVAVLSWKVCSKFCLQECAIQWRTPFVCLVSNTGHKYNPVWNVTLLSTNPKESKPSKVLHIWWKPCCVQILNSKIPVKTQLKLKAQIKIKTSRWPKKPLESWIEVEFYFKSFHSG